MGKKVCLVASYGPSYSARYSHIFIEFAILMSFKSVMAEMTPVSIQ